MVSTVWRPEISWRGQRACCAGWLWWHASREFCNCVAAAGRKVAIDVARYREQWNVPVSVKSASSSSGPACLCWKCSSSTSTSWTILQVGSGCAPGAGT